MDDSHMELNTTDVPIRTWFGRSFAVGAPIQAE
jgi:hypothetical protein